jgi:hypothetical protein
MDGYTFRHYLHYIISFYLIFGGIITDNIDYIRIHFYVTLFVLIHWLTNDGQCFLSEMDYDKNEKPNAYTDHLLGIFGIKSTPEISNFIGYATVIIPCLYSLYRLNSMDKMI